MFEQSKLYVKIKGEKTDKSNDRKKNIVHIMWQKRKEHFQEVQNIV